jgi:uncharacterized protein
MLAPMTGEFVAQPRSPREVFLELVNAIADGRLDDVPALYAEQIDVVHPFDPLRAPALRSRDELRARIPPGTTVPRHRARPAIVAIHETTDPEVIIAEFAYQTSAAGTGEPAAQPAIFVLRVRNGEIVSSRDYHDHLASARSAGRLGELFATLSAQDAAHAQPDAAN